MHTYCFHIKGGEVVVYFSGHFTLFSARCKLVSIRICCYRASQLPHSVKDKPANFTQLHLKACQGGVFDGYRAEYHFNQGHKQCLLHTD